MPSTTATEPRISKRKHQQSGLKAGKPNGTQKLGHIIRPKTLARRAAALEALYVDQARVADIGVHPKYRHGSCVVPEIAAADWDRRAKQWDADHDVVRPAKPTNSKSRRRDKAPRVASTYRAERRNALHIGANGGMGKGRALVAYLSAA